MPGLRFLDPRFTTRARAALSCAVGTLALLLCGCPGDDGSVGGTGTGTESGTAGTETDATVGLDSTGTTGEPAGTELVPCDPLTEGSCEEGVCAGDPMSGFYCRPACSSMAEEGTPCGSDDVCLPVIRGSAETACFDVRSCDFVTGEGCDGPDHCVVISLDPLRTACVPTGDTGVGQACDPSGMLDCGPGLACLGSDIEEGQDGICTGWCEPGASLPPDCPACAALSEEIGTCSECSVIADDCGPGTQCQPINEALGGVCVDIGPGGPGAPCAPLDGVCQEGLLCIELQEGTSVCIPSCDPASPMCPGEGDSCIDVDLFVPGAPSGQLGVCIDAGVMICDPQNMPTGCDAGDNCLDVGGGVGVCGAPCDPATGDAACRANAVCIPSDGSDFNIAPFVEGNGACGLGCVTDLDCGGQTCLHLDGLEVDGLCGTSCTPGMPGGCPMGQACVATPEDPMVGACMAPGTTCNPTTLGACGGGACIPLQGEMLVGICLPSCYSQDPMGLACGGDPTLCLSKTDPIWHEGTCLGGGMPCDLIDDDCPPGQACGVLGGPPFGGHAFLCDDAGALGEGDDCDPDDDQCGVGVGCIDGVCRAWCDPMAPACVTGTCNDLGPALFLPVGTLGVCQ